MPQSKAAISVMTDLFFLLFLIYFFMLKIFQNEKKKSNKILDISNKETRWTHFTTAMQHFPSCTDSKWQASTIKDWNPRHRVMLSWDLPCSKSCKSSSPFHHERKHFFVLYYLKGGAPSPYNKKLLNVGNPWWAVLPTCKLFNVIL